MRKCFCLVIFLVVTKSGIVNGQSAVYICEKTGQWGVASDDGNAPRLTFEQTKKEAIKSCKEKGGEDCKLYFSSESKGWYTFLTGVEKGKYTFAAGQSTQSEKDAYKKAIDDYLQKGGIIRPGCEFSSWYCPKDAIKRKN